MEGPQFGNRPLSPHATIYRWPANALLSISHRVTGVCLSVSALLVVWWFTAAAVSSGYFAMVDGLMTSIIGDAIMVGSLIALCYHSCNGIRHLVWDAGAGFDARNVRISSLIVVVGTVLLSGTALLVMQ